VTKPDSKDDSDDERSKRTADGGRLPRLRKRFDYHRLGLYVALLGIVAFYLAPIEAGLVTSLTTRTGVIETLPMSPPIYGEFSTASWIAAFDTLSRGLLNSALYAVPATVISAFIGSLAAYGLTQANWKRRYKATFLALFVAGIFIPYQAVLVPVTRFWSNYAQIEGLLTPLWLLGVDRDYTDLVELMITSIAYGIPICTILFRSYYKNMNIEMIEAARLDGASLRRIYRRIVLPLSTPMFAVVLIYQFTQIWNDLLFALVLVQSTSSDAAPAVLILSGLGVSQEGMNFSLQMAGALITALPTIAVYVMFSEEFSEGLAT
jgi:glucose/mannose transport system permease protein